jgi:hypothetical protein
MRMIDYNIKAVQEVSLDTHDNKNAIHKSGQQENIFLKNFEAS